MPTTTGLATYAPPNGHADDETTEDLLSIWASTTGVSASSLRHAAVGQSLSLSSSSSFSSAVRRNETTPAKRRHAGSDAATRRGRTDHDPWATDGGPGEGGKAAHVRARTLDGEGSASPWRGAGRSTSTSQHPLKVRNGPESSAHETRPSMKRMLSHNDAVAAADERDLIDDDESARHRRSVSQDREMLVVVHQVSNVLWFVWHTVVPWSVSDRSALASQYCIALFNADLLVGTTDGLSSRSIPQIWHLPCRAQTRKSAVAFRPHPPARDALHPCR
ncbi:hypothetical protein FKP32DRAFT_29394 [Trametes sanguinea]|nr:hypothetical protein FKP32DRAFT_29394 [Trametes sanguinea]